MVLSFEWMLEAIKDQVPFPCAIGHFLSDKQADIGFELFDLFGIEDISERLGEHLHGVFERTPLLSEFNHFAQDSVCVAEMGGRRSLFGLVRPLRRGIRRAEEGGSARSRERNGGGMASLIALVLNSTDDIGSEDLSDREDVKDGCGVDPGGEVSKVAAATDILVEIGMFVFESIARDRERTPFLDVIVCDSVLII